MFFDQPGTLDPRIGPTVARLEATIHGNPEWSKAFYHDYTRPSDPPMLSFFHSAYRRQALMEAAREVVRDHLAEVDAIKRFFIWLPALVEHYHEALGHDMIVAYSTARTACCDSLLRSFLRHFTRLAVENNCSIGTGASQTGGMGIATEFTSEEIRRIGMENTRSRTFGVRLGLIVDVGQPKARIDHHAPPLYAFALRMYYLALMGGCPDADEECMAKAGNGRKPGRNRLILTGGMGTISEVLADAVEFQTSKFAYTAYSHVMNQPYPAYVFVGPSVRAIQAYEELSGESTSLREIAAHDNAVIEHWESIRAKAIKVDEEHFSMQQRHDILGPMADNFAEMLSSSGMTYRGLMLQLADCLACGTVSARELVPFKFIALDDPEAAARRAIDTHLSERPSIQELHGSSQINYRA